ncbi:hypothetical protein [Thiohalophilus thiocyanatoxydans]|uniref:Uncharacterized protein n=1 Tax=Thiohalophilus thiocyanatoxydans TaxID=381308 RepID=A0A4V3H3E9_9GAMM|nr:hypothetical protein [Thiohalophilus thiocyanatoxydans]TDX98123.1 hypothetical protein EDC23_2605 [Thiohalophilus thiocyanatoxydans]
MQEQEPEPEFEYGDRSLRLNLALIVGIYFLIAIGLQPLIDFLLVPDPEAADPYRVMALAEEKQKLTGYVYSIWRMLPILFFLWYGWRIIASLRVPPAGTRSPFTVRIIKGKPARMFGMLLILVALLLLYRELLTLTKLTG